jgi:hypothetical protein
MKTMLNTAGIGIALLFGSTVIQGLNYVVYPPFGLITVSFVGLASYLILVGIYTCARELAKDSAVRKEIYKVAEYEFSLLGRIGLAELNRSIESRVSPMIAKFESSWGLNQSSQVEEGDYKKFIQDAIAELQAKADSKRD